MRSIINEYARECRRNVDKLNSLYNSFYERFIQMRYTPDSFLASLGMISSGYITVPVALLEPIPETLVRTCLGRRV